MATQPAYKIDPQNVVRTTERLWSEEVAAADPGVSERETDYQFSNNRKFVKPLNPYTGTTT
jgi:hypothetical protein